LPSKTGPQADSASDPERKTKDSVMESKAHGSANSSTNSDPGL
jgi:hypothetical protein